MLIKEMLFYIVQTIITAFVISIFLIFFTKFTHAQDSTKYIGSSYDGFSVSAMSLKGLNGIQFDSTRYRGGSFDGFAFSLMLPGGLNGQINDLLKYSGGSYDGFSMNLINQTGLNGQVNDFSKYKGGSYDGFALFSLSQIGLNGQVNDFSKYKGGNYDGFSLSSISPGGLGGLAADQNKFKGGGFDGFSVSGTQLIPLNSGTMKLKLTALMEGFYNPSVNKLIKDTVLVYLRLSTDPRHTLFDSAKVVLDSLGSVTINFLNAPTGNYYIVIKHRNSIETWSMNGQELSSGGVVNVYDFTLTQDKAYGNNMILKGTRYCMYSGDVNQDGIIDGTDLALIDNDVSNFTAGYVQTDINGDQVTDGSDLSVTDNNASNFVSVIKPPGAGTILIKGSRKNFKQGKK